MEFRRVLFRSRARPYRVRPGTFHMQVRERQYLVLLFRIGHHLDTAMLGLEEKIESRIFELELENVHAVAASLMAGEAFLVVVVAGGGAVGLLSLGIASGGARVCT